MSASLEQLADAEPDRPAVIDAERTLTRADWHARADALAAGLEAEHGVAEGDRVALRLPNRAELLEAMLALAKLGATPVALPAGSDVEAVLAAADAELLIADDATLAERHRGLDLAALAELIDANEGAERRLTGGRPAAPMITVEGSRVFVRRLDAERPQSVATAFADLLGRLALRPGERHLLAAPHEHWAPMLFANLVLIAGGTVAIADAPTPELLAGVDSATLRSAPERHDLRLAICLDEPPRPAERVLVARGSAAAGLVALDPPGAALAPLAGIEVADGRAATPLAAGGPHPL